ncbi:MAG: hypothetical protein ACLFVK_06690 [Dehalococcoidia bacterium]
MRFLNKIARPCGIAGGIWAILLAIFLLLIMPARTATERILEAVFGGTFTVGMAGMSGPWAWLIPTIIILMGLMGVVGLLGGMLARARPPPESDITLDKRSCHAGD